MRLITAPEDYIALSVEEIPCFMAGGLQKCEWHDTFLDYFNGQDTDHFVLYNPKRSSFDLSDPEVSRKQIEWEFRYLNMYIGKKPYIFSMYFDSSESVQPICFYELGRYLALLEKVQWEHVVVSCHPEFLRKLDVHVQTALATQKKVIVRECYPDVHARRVYEEYKSILEKIERIKSC